MTFGLGELIYIARWNLGIVYNKKKENCNRNVSLKTQTYLNVTR